MGKEILILEEALLAFNLERSREIVVYDGKIPTGVRGFQQQGPQIQHTRPEHTQTVRGHTRDYIKVSIGRCIDQRSDVMTAYRIASFKDLNAIVV